jgi:hypothetical protein
MKLRALTETPILVICWALTAEASEELEGQIVKLNGLEGYEVLS